MFNGYLILKVNKEDVLYLYLNNYHEFSSEFKTKTKKETLYDKVIKYIKDNKISFNGKKIMFVVNGLIIGSLMLSSTIFNNINNNRPYPYLNINQDYLIEQNQKEEPKRLSHKVLIKINNTINKVDFDDYLISEISKTVPATYNIEAIKSIAVIIRTESFKELYEQKYINTSNFIDIKILKNTWQNNFNYYYEKIKKAVIETDNEYLFFHNYFLNTKPIKIINNYTIGISNYGVNLLAKSGYNYRQILSHYYKDSTILKLKD